VDIDGATALHCAVLRVRSPNDVDCCRLLLSHGADPLAAAVSGETPLAMATELPGAVGEDVRRALGAAVARTGGKGKKAMDVSDSLSEAGSGSSSRSDGRPPGSPRKRFAAPQLGAIPSLEL
jgi:ankyrin repeat protein